MKQKSKKLTLHIWFYLALLVSLILAFLWIFQVLFFDSYYEYRTSSSLNKIAVATKEYYSESKSETDYDILSYENNACIEIVRNNEMIYSSNQMRRGCIFSGKEASQSSSYKTDFINSSLTSKTYKMNNPMLNNKTLINAVKLDSNTYAFINVSLEPTDPAISIIREELVFITIGIYILSFVFAYFISKKVSSPILKINKRAKEMAKGDLETPFEINENITEINELATTLNYTQKELSKLDETRKDLLANVSHDLKTPLTMIKAYAEMARDLNGENKEKREENLNVIIEESERLNLLVNDILTLSKNESNMDKLDKEDFDITDLINTILNRFTYLKEEGYTFNFTTERKYIINADKSKVEQVLYNLIINAVNYTGEDKTIIIKTEDYKKYIRIYVCDSGKGISKEDIEKIWDKYYKNEKNHKRRKIGTGLGLSIVKNILLKHGFNYGVESKINKGTKFYFDIPLE